MRIAPRLSPKLKHFAPFVAQIIEAVLTTSIQEYNGIAHTCMARPDRESPPSKQSSHSKFGAYGSHGRTIFRGAPPVNIVLLCACAMLLLASGIEPNPGPDTPRAGFPAPCEEPTVTPHRQATAKSVSNDTPRNVNINNNSACVQCSKNAAGDEIRAIRCNVGNADRRFIWRA